MSYSFFKDVPALNIQQGNVLRLVNGKHVTGLTGRAWEKLVTELKKEDVLVLHVCKTLDDLAVYGKFKKVCVF